MISNISRRILESKPEKKHGRPKYISNIPNYENDGQKPQKQKSRGESYMRQLRSYNNDNNTDDTTFVKMYSKLRMRHLSSQTTT